MPNPGFKCTPLGRARSAPEGASHTLFQNLFIIRATPVDLLKVGSQLLPHQGGNVSQPDTTIKKLLELRGGLGSSRSPHPNLYGFLQALFFLLFSVDLFQNAGDYSSIDTQPL